MAGRGRGRGKANLSFEIGNLGLGATGEALPTQTLQPPSLYPPLQQRPTPLASSEVDEYLLALSQEYRGSIKDSPFYLKAKTVKKDIMRYTDRYKQSNQSHDMQQWEPDWRYFPEELKPSVSRRKAVKKSIPVMLPVSRTGSKGVDVEKKLDELTKKEIAEGEGIGVEGEQEENVEGGEAGEEEEFEEEFEDDNDYNFDYYNDGGDNYGDDDDGDDGPVY